MNNKQAFQKLVDEMDRYYSHFATKPNINWRELAESYRIAAEAAKDPCEFAAAIAPMLAELEDMHVWIDVHIRPCAPPPRPLNADFEAVRALLCNASEIGRGKPPFATVGRTAQGYGYVEVSRLRAHENEVRQLVDSIKTLFDAPGMILDLRRNRGGPENVAQSIAALFAVDDREYARSKRRSGPDHNDFREDPPRRLQRSLEKTYSNPVVCLIGPNCVSSGEGFAQMMKSLSPNPVTVLGQPTWGASGNPGALDLGEGLSVSYSRWVDMMPDGTPIEGQGVQPDKVVDHKGPGDPTFVRAIEILDERTGRRQTPASLPDR